MIRSSEGLPTPVRAPGAGGISPAESHPGQPAEKHRVYATTPPVPGGRPRTMSIERFIPMLAAILALGFAACQPPKHDVRPAGPAESEALAAFMGTREEREARAPYSPPGWPLQPGDLIPSREWYALNRRFPSNGTMWRLHSG